MQLPLCSGEDCNTDDGMENNKIISTTLLIHTNKKVSLIEHDLVFILEKCTIQDLSLYFCEL